jgi:hypothetical protein
MSIPNSDIGKVGKDYDEIFLVPPTNNRTEYLVDELVLQSSKV